MDPDTAGHQDHWGSSLLQLIEKNRAETSALFFFLFYRRSNRRSVVAAAVAVGQRVMLQRIDTGRTDAGAAGDTVSRRHLRQTL